MPAPNEGGWPPWQRRCFALAGAAGLCSALACGAAETRAPASAPAQEAEARDAVGEDMDALDQSAVDGRFAPPPPAADPGAGWAGEDGFTRQDTWGDELGQLAQLENRLRSLGVAVPEHRAWEAGVDAKLGGSESIARPSETPKAVPSPAPAKRPSGSTASGPKPNDRGKSKGTPTSGGKKRAKKDKLERKAGGKNEPLSDADRGDGDLLEEREESERDRDNDRASAPEAEPMSVGQRCEAVCEVAEAICALESRICELAEGKPDNRQYADACERASEDCEVAGQACRECSRE